MAYLIRNISTTLLFDENQQLQNNAKCAGTHKTLPVMILADDAEKALQKTDTYHITL
jgi:hypothetical protein